MKKMSFRNGDFLPIIGLGTYLSKKEEVYNAVIEAIKTGYRHIDCASIYGNESEIGEALKFVINNKLVTRGELFVTSKLWNSDHAPEQVEVAVRKTLKNLQLDYLDLYLMHWPIAFNAGRKFAKVPSDLVSLEDLPVAVTWEAMEKVQQRELTKHIGVSNFSVSKLQNLLLKSTIKPEVNQVELHLYFQQPALVEFCQQHAILVTAFSPLGSRHLIHGDDSITNNETVIRMAQKNHCLPIQVVLAWGFQRGTAVIPKSVNAHRILENFNSLSVNLDDDDMEILNKIDRNLRMAQGLYAVLPEGCYTLQNIWDE